MIDFPTPLRSLNEDMRGKAGIYVLTIVGRDGTRWALRTAVSPTDPLPSALQSIHMQRRYRPEVRFVGELPAPVHA